MAIMVMRDEDKIEVPTTHECAWPLLVARNGIRQTNEATNWTLSSNRRELTNGLEDKIQIQAVNIDEPESTELMKEKTENKMCKQSNNERSTSKTISATTAMPNNERMALTSRIEQ